MSKPQIKQENPNLRITRRQHRAQKIILVQFSYSQELYQRCKRLGGRYTRTHRGWWWPVSEMTEGQLHKKLGEVTSSPDQKKEIGRPRAGNHDNIPIETGNKILKMERWMKQKRYSENTIGTYLSFVRQFFKKYPDRSWDAITKDLISHYNYKEFIAKKKANIQYLQEILGHKSPKTTMIYTHLSGKDIRSIRSPLDDMDV